jgi:transcription-repair coupling factor (superfamily II helicase)
MMLYRELDSLEDEATLSQFEAGLVDRFGKLPQTSQELLEVVRLRWVAIELGMERIILKSQKMICHFISDQKSPSINPPVFGQVLQYVQAKSAQPAA